MIDTEEIKLLTTDQLIDELKRRHPDGVIVAMQFPKHEARSLGHDWRVFFSGNSDVTLKLANVAIYQQQQILMEGSGDKPFEGDCL